MKEMPRLLEGYAFMVVMGGGGCSLEEFVC